MKWISFFAIALFVQMILAPPSRACSVFCSQDPQRSSVGYSMEWVGRIFTDSSGTELEHYQGGGLFLNPKGLRKKSILPGSPFHWTSKYNSLVLSEFGPDFGFNGINEKGLEVYLLGTPSRAIDKGNGTPISELDALAVILDQAANTEEAIEILQSVRIEHQLFPLHFFLKDKSGKVAIIEYPDGMKIYHPSVKDSILTNGFFEDEIAQRQSGERIYADNRALDIQLHLKEKPKDIQGALKEAGDYQYTLWSTESKIAASSWTYLIRVKPNCLTASNQRQMRLDLNNLFDPKQFPKDRRFLLFSEFTKSGKNSARPVTDEDIRLMQLSNFLEVKKNQESLLGRNGNKVRDSQRLLKQILANLPKEPMTQVMKPVNLPVKTCNSIHQI